MAWGLQVGRRHCCVCRECQCFSGHVWGVGRLGPDARLSSLDECHSWCSAVNAKCPHRRGRGAEAACAPLLPSPVVLHWAQVSKRRFPGTITVTSSSHPDSEAIILAARQHSGDRCCQP